jgi:hypothetical protein
MKMNSDSERYSPVMNSGPGRIAKKAAATRASRRLQIRSAIR